MTNCEAIITVDAANVRVQPNASTAIVGIANRGMRFQTLERTPQAQRDGFFWFRVQFSATMQGWLRADLIQLVGDCADMNTVSTTPAVSIGSPAPTPLLLPPAEEPVVLIGDCRAEVTVFSATVRRGPAITNPIAGFLSRGATFAITDISEADSRGFRWYAFDFQGSIGWVREDIANTTGDCLDPRTHIDPPTPVTPTPTPPIPTPVVPPPTAGCFGTIGLPTVTVRALPSTQSDRLGMATNAQRLPVRNVTDVQGDGFRWIEITFNGRAGFIRADLLTLEGDCAAFNDTGLLPRPASGRLTQDFRPPTNPTHNGIDIGTSGNQELRTPLPATVERVMACRNCTPERPNITTTDPALIAQIFNDANWGFGYGNHIILRFRFADLPQMAQQRILQAGANTTMSVFVLFAHLSEMRVQLGQQIAAGTVFGVTGNTGFSSAPHLHLEVAFGTSFGTATKVNPSTVFGLI